MKYAIRTTLGLFCWFDTDTGTGGFSKDIDDDVFLFDGIVDQRNADKEIIKRAWNYEKSRK